MSAESYIMATEELAWLPEERRAELAREIEAEACWPNVATLMEKRASGSPLERGALLALARRIAEKAVVSPKRHGAVIFTRIQLDEAQRLVMTDPRASLVHTRPAGALLEILGLLDPDSPLTTAEVAELWETVRRRYCAAASGNVTALL